MIRRCLSNETTWWLGMLPAFVLATYFVKGWVDQRNDPSTLLSAIGALAAGVIITCMVAARNEGVSLTVAPAAPVVEPDPEPVVHEPAPFIAVKLKEENPWFAKGLSLASSKQYRDALYCFTYVLQSDPTNEAALTAKGECLMKMNRPEEALKAFMAAAHIDESNPLAQECKDAVIRKVRAATYF